MPEGLGMCGGVHTSHGLPHGGARRPLTRALLKQHQESPSQPEPSLSSFAVATALHDRLPSFMEHTPESMHDSGAQSLQRSESFPPAVKPQVPWRLISTPAQPVEELPNIDDLLRAASHLPAFPDDIASKRLEGAIVSPAQGVIQEPIVALQPQVTEVAYSAPTEAALPDQAHHSGSNSAVPNTAAHVVGAAHLAALLAILCEGMPTLPPPQANQHKAFLPDGSGTGSGSLEDSESKLERSSQESAGCRLSSDEDLSAAAATSSGDNAIRSALAGSALAGSTRSSGSGPSDQRPATGNSGNSEGVDKLQPLSGLLMHVTTLVSAALAKRYCCSHCYSTYCSSSSHLCNMMWFYVLILQGSRCV